ncbi:MAG: hypothetical protein ACRDY7_18050 [Acidimicrobiia bacterium]
MIRRVLFAAPLLVAVGVALPAEPAFPQAAACQPLSAEHAFEELLDVAEDDSPLEDEAWRIADAQEAKGAFETPETQRMVDELARSNGLTYDCPTRRYVPVSGPDPRVAIEEGTEPPESEPDALAPDGPAAPGDPTVSAPGVSGPGQPGGATTPGGVVGAGPVAGGGVAGGQAGVGGGDGGVPSAGSPGADPTIEAAGGSGQRLQEAPGRGSDGTPGTGIKGVVLPGSTPAGDGGAVALPGGQDAAADTPMRTLALGGLAAAAIGAVAAAAMSVTRRRRQDRQLA